MKGILADTSVIIDYLAGKSSEAANTLLESHKVSISILTHYEVCKYMLRVGEKNPLQVVSERLSKFEALPLSIEICERAAKISHSTGMPAADALIYATGILSSLKVAASEEHFEGMPDVIYFGPKKKRK